MATNPRASRPTQAADGHDDFRHSYSKDKATLVRRLAGSKARSAVSPG